MEFQPRALEGIFVGNFRIVFQKDKLFPDNSGIFETQFSVFSKA